MNRPSAVFVLLALACIHALATACCSSRDTAAAPDARDTVIIGTGGGFSGIYTAYQIAGDGTVSGWQNRPASGDSTWPLFEFSKETTAMIFNELAAINFTEIDFNRPGNLTYFVRLVNDTARHSVHWGDLGSTPPEEVQRFYDSTLARVQRRTGK